MSYCLEDMEPHASLFLLVNSWPQPQNGAALMEGRIEYSSLVTLLANGLGLMENALVEQISRGRPYITVDHLRQGQLLKGWGERILELS
jgi:hypothetical protein